MEKKKRTVYEAPEVSIVTLAQECVICNGSPVGNELDDYNFGGLDESGSLPGIFGFGL